MTAQDLDHLERALDCVLPRWYRDFMLGYPAELRSPTYWYTDDDGNVVTHCPADHEFRDSADAIVQLNKGVYSNRFDHWPESHLVIGSTLCGDAFAIDTQSAVPDVYRAEPSSGYFAPAVDGLDMYFEKVENSLEEFALSLVLKYKTRCQ